MEIYLRYQAWFRPDSGRKETLCVCATFGEFGEIAEAKFAKIKASQIMREEI